MKICAGSLGNFYIRIYRMWCIADISARSMFCSPISLWGRFIFSRGFHMPYPACAGSHVPLVCRFGGVNEPFV